MKNKAIKATKKFVDDHKVGLTIAGTSYIWIAINKHNMRSYDNYLVQKGLYQDFWNLEI